MERILAVTDVRSESRSESPSESPYIARSKAFHAAGDSLTVFRNPYKGLRSFREADAPDFFGRSQLVAELVSRLNDAVAKSAVPRFLALVGPSGSGKSSVVRAGLIPSIRSITNDKPHGTKVDWFITTMTPGQHPFEEFASAIGRIATSPITLPLTEMMAPRGLARVVKGTTNEDSPPLLLVIDQFEELFTLTSDAERANFLNQLVEVATERGLNTHVVVTMRADFYDRALSHDGLTQLLSHSTVPIGPLSTTELTSAITGPAEAVGVEFEPGLVDRVVRDVHSQPGGLPLLQYALTELFDNSERGCLTHSAYVRSGGFEGTIASRADALLREAPDEQIARRLFTRLVALGDGVEDTRRRVRLADLQPGAERDDLVEAFGTARLLTFDRDPLTREPTVELAHEALITRWPKLKEWLLEDRDALRALDQVRVAAFSWEQRGRDDSDLFRGARLELTTGELEGQMDSLSPGEQEFLRASQLRAAAEAASSRRATRRLQRSLVGVACLAAAALVAGSIAWQSRERATGSARRAETARLAASAPALAQTNLSLGLLAAAESFRREQSPETVGALQRVLIAQDRILGFVGSGRSYVAVDINDTTIFGLRDGSIDRWNLSTLDELASLDIPAKPLAPYALAQRRAFSIGGDYATVRFADLSTVIVGLKDSIVRPLPATVAATVSPDGRQVAIVSADLAVHLLDTGSLVQRWATAVPTDQTYADQASMPGPPGPALPTAPLFAEVAFVGGGDLLSSRGARVQRLSGVDGRTLSEAGERFALTYVSERVGQRWIGRSFRHGLDGSPRGPNHQRRLCQHRRVGCEQA